MKRRASWFYLFIFLCISSEIFAQKTRSNYQLLWKISGNGLKKPSYLFGTMHLRDKRVFDFSDSVLVKLEECQAFAMEVTPDSMLSQAFSLIMEEEDNNYGDLEEKLSPDEYKELQEKLKSEGIDINKIKYRSPKKIVDLLSNPLPRKSDKETFLDAYLYRIAKENNKRIEGLEKIKEHIASYKESTNPTTTNTANPVDTIYKQEIKQLKTYLKYHGEKNVQNLIDIYWEGNIKNIEKFYEGADSAYLENLLYKRNIKMKEKMIELMNGQSTFVAVGAGHLPGEKGLIELLKNYGYTVTPVKATFTGLASKYIEKPLNNDWVKFSVDEHLYSAEFPSQPILYSKKDGSNIGGKLYIYPDLATGLFYYSLSIPMAKTLDDDANIFIDRYIQIISKQRGSKLLVRKKIIYKGYEGAEVVLFNQRDAMYIKLKLAVRKSSLYTLMVGSYNESLLSTKDADKFFQSLELKEYKNPSWVTLNHDEGAFSVNSPFKLEMNEQTTRTPSGKVETKLFTTTDQNKGIAYYVGYYNFEAGRVITNDSVYFGSLLPLFTERLGGTLEDSSDIIWNGYPGLTFTVAAGQNVHVKGMVVLRGNRPYIIFVVTSKDKLKDKDVSDFIESLKFNEYKSTYWTDYTSEDYNYTIKIPSPMKMEVDSTDYKTIIDFYSIDKNSSTSYTVHLDKLSAYDFRDKVDYFKNRYKDYLETDDSLVYQKNVTLNGLNGKEIIVHTSASNNQKRILFIPKDDYEYSLICYAPAEYCQSKDVDQFYSSFKFTDNSKEIGLFKSKAKIILNDLSSADSTTRARAKSSLYSYEFQKEDLPQIYETLKKSFPDDTNRYWNIKTTLFTKLGEVNDNTTIPFLKDLYQTADSNLEIHILKPLIHIGSEEGISTFLKLVEYRSPKKDYLPYNFFLPLKDSLEMNKSIFPKISHLYKNKIFRNQILNLAIILIDSNAITTSYFDSEKDEVLKYAKLALANLPTSDIHNDYEYYENNTQFISFLSKIKQDSSIENYLKSVAESKNWELSYEAVEAQIKNNYLINVKDIDKLASNNLYRIKLLKALKEKNKTNLFPAKWLKQNFIAESSIMNYLSDYDDYAPSKISLLNSRIFSYEGKEQKFYLFKVCFESGEWYTALSGPFPLEQSEICTEPKINRCNYEKVKSMSIDNHFKSLMK